ncbi:2-amino-4-hydroxy-6-hydroxymethyldihydropteridinediphosphokinase [Polaribacter sp. Hel1_33_78]|jgi:deoxyguanosine kinase|uniref:2-amino-4-hydroxy-6- hydroxymethyldihydropteridine diphosphokinase n=2 Tax=Polaribacter TaxID=52959 RepID=UPI00052C03BD|nr:MULTISPECIES: 2-amino-4-hydroxy-6-hydroxymethyldihydropteridine diphosphokinase [unclassified Polaribacter]MBT3741960.1 2-amino-4-hydroxy-6-hydroxymethyldihydropteridine diphosphokinase [Polaribacter sp.]KGL59422.1 7,8-dihydro-6-hydroxymethylpterin- pyrophosphokinase (HPPK)/deoxynucleoside kinase [Polaribacter sp. Hel1_33_49]MBT4413738.1 2-amino-4-hydroxy-6-hydroxymethyldihydropteridine diphosphokinase [Polaribacter sp.]MBT7815962.1 2-amino-4-hydroxy-6-hydroxymethyldihydropteridine diphospho
MKIQRITYLSLGTNQGNKLENLQNAINLIADKAGAIQKISSVYKTASWGFESNDFYNICIKVTTYHAPERLMSILLKIENELGRRREDLSGYTDRNIDIDILLFDDEIIFSRKLIVPHSKMLERKFVLIPLAEIADTIMHPIEKKTLSICLKNCNDTSEVFKIDGTLLRPIPLSEKYNYIAIEGNIGAGKTSLSKMMSDEFNAKIVLERFADNPFLPKFYEDKERFAFPLEMSFLADRYQQLSDDLAQLDLFKNLIVSDYYIFKSLIFAQITLQKDEYLLYRKMFDLMYKEIRKPDLYVYLYQNTDRLLQNIKKRGREYEQNIEAAYLQKIHDGYKNFISTQQELNILIIDVSEIDFVNNTEDYSYILNKIKNT